MTGKIFIHTFSFNLTERCLYICLYLQSCGKSESFSIISGILGKITLDLTPNSGKIVIGTIIAAMKNLTSNILNCLL